MQGTPLYYPSDEKCVERELRDAYARICEVIELGETIVNLAKETADCIATAQTTLHQINPLEFAETIPVQ